MIHARRLDIIVIDKKERKGIIIDIAVPADVRIGEKEMEKVEKIPGLEERDQKIVETQMIEVLPLVIGALAGSVNKGFDKWIGKLGIPLNVGVMQKPALLRTGRILRKVLEM